MLAYVLGMRRRIFAELSSLMLSDSALCALLLDQRSQYFTRVFFSRLCCTFCSLQQCSSDEQCLNGGTCSDGVCACAFGWCGAFCAAPADNVCGLPTEVRLLTCQFVLQPSPSSFSPHRPLLTSSLCIPLVLQSFGSVRKCVLTPTDASHVPSDHVWSVHRPWRL